MGDNNETTAQEMEPQQAIGQDQVRKATEILRKYKSGKKNLEERIVRNEQWWKVRHWDLMEDKRTRDDPKPASAWLHNMIVNKHADIMDSFPDSDILPREIGDVEEARRLSSIIPVVMEQNGYRKIYSEEAWQKLKDGTGVFGVYWDQSKLNGLGDITINCVDLLNIFWEPGVKDIQKSRNIFTVELVDNDLLEEQYPQCAGQLGKGSDSIVKKYIYDDSVDTSNKSAVIDWYYHKRIGGKNTLQYCKYVGDIVLYATENDTEVPTETRQQPVFDESGQALIDENGMPVMQPVQVQTGVSVAERGLYDHGMYPFVFDVLWPEEGMPVGFGLIDIDKNPQESIDIYNNCIEKNFQYVCSPRYLVRNDGGINEEEFADPNVLLVHTDGNLGQDSYAVIQTPTMANSNYIAIMQNKIEEMKETSGNHDTTTGAAPSGVTAASAIAALQEAAGKTSRDQIATTYEAHKQVVTLVIELIRQYYSMPRQFRITGEHGDSEFVTYDNAGLQPQSQGVEFGVDMGYRLPVFDIKVEAEKASSYSRLSQNELALQFYNAGFFRPDNADQAISCMDMMEFQGKQETIEKIQTNGTLYQQLITLQKQMLQLSEMFDKVTNGKYNMAQQVAQGISGNIDAMQQTNGSAAMPKQQTSTSGSGKDNAIVSNARTRAAEATRPGQQ